LEKGQVISSYWNIETSGSNSSSGGVGLDTEEMTGVDALEYMEGFEFYDVWETVERTHEDSQIDGYPVLITSDRKEQIESQYLSVKINTLSAEAITPSSALLRGELIGVDTPARMEVSFAYRSQSYPIFRGVSVGTFDEIGEFFFNLDGLSPETTYYYYAHIQIYYDGRLTTTVGNLEEFTTDTPETPWVVPRSASEVTFNSAVLNAELTHLGLADEAEVYFQYREDEDDEWNETTSEMLYEPQEFDYTIYGLEPDTAYYFRPCAEGVGKHYGETARLLTRKPSTLTISISSTEGGSIEKPGEGSFHRNYGESIQLKAEPDEGYRFVEWTGDIENIECLESKETNITEIKNDYEIEAVFDVALHRLDIDVEGEGYVDVDPEKEEYKHGAEAKLTAIPEDGWIFDSWSGDVESTEKYLNLTMDDDKEISANFLREAYFEVSIIEPGEEVMSGELEVICLVTNIGDIEGTYTVELEIFEGEGSKHVRSEEVTLEGKEERELEFEWSPSAGEYRIQVNILEDDKIVEMTERNVLVNEEPLDIGLVLGLSIGILALISVSVLWMYKYREKNIGDLLGIDSSSRDADEGSEPSDESIEEGR